MANMFDFFTNTAGRLRTPVPYVDPRTQLEEEHRRQRLAQLGQMPASTVMPGPQNPAGSVGGTGAGTELVNDVARPRLAPAMPGAMTPVAQEDPMQRRLRLAREKSAMLRDTTGDPVYDEQGRQIGGKVVNNDRGVLGRIGDVLRQAVISAGEAYNNGSGDPGQRLMAAIGGGIAGGIGGGFRPTLDEERQRLYDINRSQEEEGTIQGQIEADQARRMREAQIGVQEAAPGIERGKLANTRAGIMADNLKAQQKQVFDAWQTAVKQGDFSMSNPKYSDLVLQAREYGVPIFDAKPDDEFFGSWSQDGTYAILNKRTGEERKGFGGEKFQKPVTVAESDLSDERFPWLLTDKDIDLRALESVSPEADSVEINQQAQNDLLNYQNSNGEFPYRNPDGSFNKNKFLQDTAFDLAPMGYSTLYRSQAKSLANKVAAKKRQLLDSQKNVRAELGRFKLALKGRPVTEANEAVDMFNQIMQEPDTKKRKRALTEFYKQLS